MGPEEPSLLFNGGRKKEKKQNQQKKHKHSLLDGTKNHKEGEKNKGKNNL